MIAQEFRNQLRRQYRVVERIWAEGKWKASSAIHLGGEGIDLESEADMVLLRDSQGRFYIPAASIAGASRSRVARYLMPREDFGSEDSRGSEPAEVRALFGGGSTKKDNRDAKYASLLTVLDAACSSNDPCVFTRDGVRIKSDTGVAADKGKYDFQVLPAGTEFSFQLCLTLYNELPFKVNQESLIACFQYILDSFHDGVIRLGARTRRGLGEGRVEEWAIRRLHMDELPGLLAWLEGQRQNVLPIARICEPDVFLKPPQHDRTETLTISAELRLKTSLLIRGPGEKPGGPDMVQLTENESPLITGTSLAGALRHRCERIAKTLGVRDWEKLLEKIFGTLLPDEKSGDAISLQAGKLSVSERPLSNGELLVQSRVAIDRFSGGALETALFDEAPFFPNAGGGSFQVVLSLDNPEPQEAALLLLAFKDFWLGDLPIGGEVGVGRGVFQGLKATISWPGQLQLTLTGDQNDPASVEVSSEIDADRLEKWIAQLGSRKGGD